MTNTVLLPRAPVRSLLLLTLLAAAGCREPSTEQVLAEDFDQGCEVNADCIGVIGGGVCCPTTPIAIASSEREAFEASFPEDPYCPAYEERDACFTVPFRRQPICDAGVCTLTEERCTAEQRRGLTIVCPGIDEDG